APGRRLHATGEAARAALAGEIPGQPAVSDLRRRALAEGSPGPAAARPLAPAGAALAGARLAIDAASVAADAALPGDLARRRATIAGDAGPGRARGHAPDGGVRRRGGAQRRGGAGSQPGRTGPARSGSVAGCRRAAVPAGPAGTGPEEAPGGAKGPGGG